MAKNKSKRNAKQKRARRTQSRPTPTQKLLARERAKRKRPKVPPRRRPARYWRTDCVPGDRAHNLDALCRVATPTQARALLAELELDPGSGTARFYLGLNPHVSVARI